ncbi:beta-glucosidase 11-like isoform X1 [Tripterygium wilfordii]|nr:beta-glucosidase 11-like isoform X1 [Tripterygium wilfordii]
MNSRPARMLYLLFFLVILLNIAVLVFGVEHYSREDFPPGFVFGAGTSAYQVEGAAKEYGRTPSIWDTFLQKGNANETGDVACDGYHKYKEDVQLMVDTGLEAYRFSISWSRLIPNGRGRVNPKGLQYYNNLINELVKHGIEPHVTLHHHDLPQILEDEYGGWVNRKIVKDFTAYADVCFREFGDRISYWTTVNEPNIFSVFGYDLGGMGPGRCSSPFGKNCYSGNSSTEPYLVVHHILLAHASAARLYRNKYWGKQNGFIGISVLVLKYISATNSTEDVNAIQRAYDFFVGWVVHPLVYGDYPNIMKEVVGSRLPVFTNYELRLIKGSFDFLGVLHYCAAYVKDNSRNQTSDVRDYSTDMGVLVAPITHDNKSLYEFPARPWELQDVLEYFKQAYDNPPIYIHENGQQTKRISSLEDTSRVRYLHAYIGSVLDALRNGSNVRGYFAWSFLDLFEIMVGYSASYGLYYVDRDDLELRRYPKLSAYWYSHFLKRRSVRSSGIEVGKNLPAPSLANFSSLAYEV